MATLSPAPAGGRRARQAVSGATQSLSCGGRSQQPPAALGACGCCIAGARRAGGAATRAASQRTTPNVVPIVQQHRVPPRPAGARVRARYRILLVLFLITTINYADRATLSIVGTDLSRELGLDRDQDGLHPLGVHLGLRRCRRCRAAGCSTGSARRRIYAAASSCWSAFHAAAGRVGFAGAGAARWSRSSRCASRWAPPKRRRFPANAELVAGWFPTAERGTASAIFNSAQYFATVLFAPLMGWVTHAFGWPWVFIVMGLTRPDVRLSSGSRLVQDPPDHPRVNRPRSSTSSAGGGAGRHATGAPRRRAAAAGSWPRLIHRAAAATGCCSASISASTASTC